MHNPSTSEVGNSWACVGMAVVSDGCEVGIHLSGSVRNHVI